MSVKKKNNVKQSKNKGGVQKKSKNSSLDIAVSKLYSAISPTITFIMEDSSKTILPINNEFLVNDRGRRKSVGELKNDLFALQHDYNAVGFRI